MYLKWFAGLNKVIHEIHTIWTDCSTGPEYLGSPQADVINTSIVNLYFPSAWKLTRISAIPKGRKTYDQYQSCRYYDLIEQNKIIRSCIISAFSAFDTVTAFQKPYQKDEQTGFFYRLSNLASSCNASSAICSS